MNHEDPTRSLNEYPHEIVLLEEPLFPAGRAFWGWLARVVVGCSIVCAALAAFGGLIALFVL